MNALEGRARKRLGIDSNLGKSAEESDSDVEVASRTDGVNNQPPSWHG